MDEKANEGSATESELAAAEAPEAAPTAAPTAAAEASASDAPGDAPLALEGEFGEEGVEGERFFSVKFEGQDSPVLGFAVDETEAIRLAKACRPGLPENCKCEKCAECSDEEVEALVAAALESDDDSGSTENEES